MFSQVQSEADSAELGPREAGSIVCNKGVILIKKYCYFIISHKYLKVPIPNHK